MIENVALLLFLIVASFLWIYEAIFAADVEKENRRFWIKAIAVISVVGGVFLWVIVKYWAPR